MAHKEGRAQKIFAGQTNDCILTLSLNMIKRKEMKLKKGDRVEYHKCVFNSKFFSIE